MKACILILILFFAGSAFTQQKVGMEHVIQDTSTLRLIKGKLTALKGSNQIAELARNYKTIGDYYYKKWASDSLLYYYRMALEEYKKIKDSFYIYYCFFRIGEQSYNFLEDKGELLRYFLPAANYFERERHYVMGAHSHYVTSNIYKSLNKTTLQNKHFEKARQLNEVGKDTMLTIIMLMRKSDEYDHSKQWSKVIESYERVIELSRLVRNAHFTKLGLYHVGRAYYYSGQYHKAIEVLRENIKGQVASKTMQTEALRYLGLSYMQINDKKTAEYYIEYYRNATDTVRKIEKKEHHEELIVQYETGHKQSVITSLQKENQLKQELASNQRKYIIGLVILMLMLLTTGGIIFRNFKRRQSIEARLSKQQEEFSNRLQVEKEQTLMADFNKQLAEVQLTALSAQINPHFIFNCMNSIQKYILKNEKSKALQFLQNFSELMRSVLDNSMKTKINLDEEINTLEKYIQLEQQRLDHGFDYKITVAPDLQTDFFAIPSLIIQPYVENAIWHGLMNKNGKGTLSLSFAKQNGYIQCVVEDDGVGRCHALELEKSRSPKRNSYGMAIAEKRLQLLQINKDSVPEIRVEDLCDNKSNPSGTRVIINMQVD